MGSIRSIFLFKVPYSFLLTCFHSELSKKQGYFDIVPDLSKTRRHVQGGRVTPTRRQGPSPCSRRPLSRPVELRLREAPKPLEGAGSSV